MSRRHAPAKIAGLALCLMAAACLAPALDFSDVQNLIKNQVPEPVIINMTRNDANLAITQEQANQLRSLGASDNLIRSIRPANPGAAATASTAGSTNPAYGAGNYGQPPYGAGGGVTSDGYEMLYEQPRMDYDESESAYAQGSAAGAYGNYPGAQPAPPAAQTYQQPAAPAPAASGSVTYPQTGAATTYAQTYAGTGVQGTTSYAAPSAGSVAASTVPSGPVYYDPNIYYPDGTVVTPGTPTVYYESNPGYVVTSPPAVVTTPTYVYPETYYYDNSPSWGFSIGWGSGGWGRGWDGGRRYYDGYRGGHRPPPPPPWNGGDRRHDRPGPPRHPKR